MIYYGIFVFLSEWNFGDVFDGVLFGGGGFNIGLFEVYYFFCV